MHVVAITHAPRVVLDGSYRASGGAADAPLESWLGPVAKLLSLVPYDLRLRLAGAAPWLVARVATAAGAKAIATQLEAIGCGVVTVDVEALEPPLQPTRVFLREEGIFAEPQLRLVRYADLILVVVATIEEEQTSWPPSAMQRRGVSVPVRSVHERTRQRALYLFEREQPIGMRIVEGSVGFQDIKGATSRIRFDAFLEGIQERSSATIEDRMVSEPRRQTSYGVQLGDATRSVNQGNLRETDLAASLLALALAQSGTA